MMHSGEGGLEMSLPRPAFVFFCILGVNACESAAITKPLGLLRRNALRLYKSYNHCPSTRLGPAHVAESWFLALLQVLQKMKVRLSVS